MGYLKIPNLYKDQSILLFRECYALEKVHGTSAHIRWDGESVGFFSGGAKHATFLALFDEDALRARFEAIGCDEVVVYGEAYGGKTQGMRETYGNELRFIVFDVKIGQAWLSVPDMSNVADTLLLEVVPWERVPTTLAAIDLQRDSRSMVANMRGCGDRPREGVVLRPVLELQRGDGKRIICKHKGEAFAETKTPRQVDPEKLKVLEGAKAIAEEWVTPMRLSHVLDKLSPDGTGEAPGMERMGEIIKAMVDDVVTEAEGEAVIDKPARKAIGARAAQLMKARLQATLQASG